MRAAWAFWTKPWATHYQIWRAEKYHLFSWVLSVERASRHYPDTALYTDDEGVRLLVDGLGLQFGEVHNCLNALSGYDPGWWSLGKIYAHRETTVPSVFIDSDVYLWKPLPEELVEAPAFAQNPEHFRSEDSFYEPIHLENALAAYPDTWLPDEWRWYRRQGSQQQAPCCGIVGGTDCAFLRQYASAAMRILDHPANARPLADYRDKGVAMILLEQYCLGAFIEYHRVPARYLFDSVLHALDENAAAERGYTHLLSDAKRNPNLSEKLEARVRREYPAAYRRCLDVAEEVEAALGRT